VRRGRLSGAAAVALPPAVFVLALFITWDLYVRWRDVKVYLLPPPVEVFRALANDPGRFVDAAAESLAAALGGLLIASAVAFGLAVVMAHSRTLERALYQWEQTCIELANPDGATNALHRLFALNPKSEFGDRARAVSSWRGQA